MFEQHPDAIKWNQRYQAKSAQPDALPQPCSLLRNQQQLLPQAGIALDLACGLGGNAVFMAQRGLVCHAWDISAIALSRLDQVAQQNQLPITTQLTDIETQPPTPDTFDCIVVSYFLDRTLCSAIEAALKPGGLLFYQTFSINKVSSNGPSSERFLLKNNELLDLFSGLNVRFYQDLGHHGNIELGDHDTAQLIAQKPF